jgi:hypothetical protein
MAVRVCEQVIVGVMLREEGSRFASLLPRVSEASVGSTAASHDILDLRRCSCNGRAAECGETQQS